MQGRSGLLMWVTVQGRADRVGRGHPHPRRSNPRRGTLIRSSTERMGVLMQGLPGRDWPRHPARRLPQAVPGWHTRWCAYPTRLHVVSHGVGLPGPGTVGTILDTEGLITNQVRVLRMPPAPNPWPDSRDNRVFGRREVKNLNRVLGVRNVKQADVALKRSNGF